MTERTLPHHQRHPPDVEEALSSMLWTPYERTPNESSAEEDEEMPNEKPLLRSHSNYDQQDTAAYHQRYSNALEYFGSNLNANFVPFSDLILNNDSTSSLMDAQHKNVAATIQHNYRYSNPCFGALPNLAGKWWSPSSSNNKELPTYESLYAFKSFPNTLTSSSASMALKLSSPEKKQQNNDSARKPNLNGNDNSLLMSSLPDDFKECSTQHANATCCVTELLGNSNNKQNSVSLQTVNDDDRWQQLQAANERSQQNKENNNNVLENAKQTQHVYEEKERLEQETDNNNARINNTEERVSQLAVTRNSRTFASATCIATSSVELKSLQCCDKATNASYSEFASDELSIACESRATISTSSAAEVSGSLVSVFNVLPYALPSLSLASSSSPPPSYFGSTECVNFVAATPSLTSSTADCSINTLTPNKCMAELERLYAEFRASESAFEQRHKVYQVDSNNKNAQEHSDSVNNNCDQINSPTFVRAKPNNKKITMRLSIPAATTATATTTSPITTATAAATMTALNVADADAGRCTNATSSVFLTTTAATSKPTTTTTTTIKTNGNSNSNSNSNCFENNMISLTETKIAAACQRHPSLTIQVNSNNNNHNYTSDKSNHYNNLNQQQQVANNNNNNNNINNNCVSVVNCAYVQATSNSNNNNNNNNNNNSIENICNTNNSRSYNKIYNHNHYNNNNNNNDNNNVNSIEKYIGENSDSNRVSIVPTNATSVSVTTTDNAPITSANIWHKNNVQNNATTSDIVNVININTPIKNNLLGTTITATSAAAANVKAVSLTPRTFTSTECQTDELTPINSGAAATSYFTREQRRRERRERRQHRQDWTAVMSPSHRRLTERHSMPPAALLSATGAAPIAHMHHATATMPAAMSALLRPMLPDILHNHFPPPYSALSLNSNVLHNSAPPASLIGAPPPPPPPPPLLTPVISTVPLPGATQIVTDARFSLPLPIIRRSPSERSGKGCCGQWFAGPPLRALIAVVALGGVACALGGAALGATGFAGPPSSHLTAALLMIGVGVVLVTVSGAAWRMTAPGGPPCLGLGSGVDLGRCGRRPCSRGGGAPHGLLYPEFQHRPPPPSYQASMQEYRLRLLLLDRDRQSNVVRGGSPPPTYRSHAGSLLRAPLTTTSRGGGGGSSSIGGSEYSLPPSYRSRNATPATCNSDNSIEFMPSGRLLANEDLPKPSNAAAVEFSREITPKTTTTTTTATTAACNRLRTSAIVEIEATHNSNDIIAANQALDTGSRTIIAEKDKEQDLVTIVTISQNESAEAVQASRANRDQIEILAHL